MVKRSIFRSSFYRNGSGCYIFFCIIGISSQLLTLYLKMIFHSFLEELHTMHSSFFTFDRQKHFLTKSNFGSFIGSSSPNLTERNQLSEDFSSFYRWSTIFYRNFGHRKLLFYSLSWSLQLECYIAEQKRVHQC